MAAKKKRDTPYIPVPPPKPVGAAGPENPLLKALQAAEIVRMRVVENKTVDEVAEALDMSRATVYRRLEFAEKNGILAEMQKIVLSKIVPKAVEAYSKALDLKDDALPNTLEVNKVRLQAGKDILFGSGVLSKDAGKQQPSAEEMSLEWWHAQKEQKSVNPSGTQSLPQPVPEPLVIEAGAEATLPSDGQERPQGGDDGPRVGGGVDESDSCREDGEQE